MVSGGRQFRSFAMDQFDQGAGGIDNIQSHGIGSIFNFCGNAMSTVNQCGAGRSLFRFIYGVNALLLKASDGKFIVYYFMKNENIITL